MSQRYYDCVSHPRKLLRDFFVTAGIGACQVFDFYCKNAMYLLILFLFVLCIV